MKKADFKVVHLHDWCNTVVIAPANKVQGAVSRITKHLVNFGIHQRKNIKGRDSHVNAFA